MPTKIVPVDKLAREVVEMVFRDKLGRSPAPHEFPFQTAFLLEGRLTVTEFALAIAGTEEARLFHARKTNPVVEGVWTIDGCEFLIPVDSSLAEHLNGAQGYEWWALPLFLEECRPGKTVVDIGANWGVYTVPAARRVGPAGKVFAFEPNPKNMKILVRNALRNKLVNITFMNCAVSDRFGLAVLPDDVATNSGMIITDQKVALSEAVLWDPVSTVPLDAMRGALGQVDLIKMDIEGGEFVACMGALDIIERDRPTVFLEFTPILLRNISKVEPGALLDIFLSRHYTVDVLHQQGSPERLGGSRDEIVARAIAATNDVTTHVDLRLLPPV